MTTNFIGVLLTTTPNYTVGSGFVSQIYDSRGAQTITVQAGGSLDLVGALGANTINLHGTASAWQIWRDGSTAILSHTNGDRINLPAQLDAQKIVFSDLQANLKIDTSSGNAQVKLGDLVLDANPVTITSAAVNTGTISNATKAPWSLVLNTSTGSKSTGYTQNLLVSDGTAVGTNLLPIDQSIQNVVVSPDATKAVFTSYQSDGTQKLQMLKNNVITNQGTVDSSVQPIDLGDKVFFLPQSTDIARTASVTDWSTDQSNFSTVMGGSKSNFKLDSTNQAIWMPQFLGPFGTELVNVAVGSNGSLTASMPKDIAVGSNSGLSSSGKSGSGQLDGAVLPDGRIVFAANDGATGMEPWVSDGTEQGTKLLRDLYSYSSKSGSGSSSSPSGFVTLGNKILFTAVVNKQTDGTISEKGRELVITDGTEAGTVVYDLTAGSSWSSPQFLDQLNGYQYFSTQSAIYRTNGGAPEKLSDWDFFDSQILGHSEQRAFITKSDSGMGSELWMANFSTRTLSLVKDIMPGVGGGMTAHSNQVRQMVGEKFVFTAYKSATELTLYVTNGTSGGTYEVATAPIVQFAVINNDRFIYRTTTGIFGFQVGDGAPTLSTLTTEISIQSFQTDSNQVFYQTSTGALYASGGTSASTVKIAESVNQFKLIADDAIYFTKINTNTSNMALWYSDGTTAGTQFIEDLPTGSYNLTAAFGLRNASAPVNNDTVAPVLKKATVNGASITLSFNDYNDLDAAHPPAANAFSLTGTDAAVSSVVVNASAKTVTLNLSKAVSSSDTVKVTYTDPSINNDSFAIQDTAGNDAASFTNRYLINATPDNVAPVFSSAVVNGSVLTLYFSDASILDAVNVPTASRFSLGGTTATVTSIAVNSTNKSVVLNLSAPVKSSDTITVSYVDPTTGNDTLAIQDINGYDAVSISNAVVINQTPVEEVKAPWMLLLQPGNSIYMSDGTKLGSDYLTLPDGTYPTQSGLWVANADKTAGVLVFNTYSAVGLNYSYKVYGIGGSLQSLTLLGAGIDTNYNNTIYKLGDKIVFAPSPYDWVGSNLSGLVTDVTVSGTKLIPSLRAGILDDSSQTIWSTLSSVPYGRELFKISLSDANPSMSLVEDIYPGTSSGLNYLTNGTNNQAALLPSGKLVFSAYTPTLGFEPWVSDGTEAGTFPLDLYPSPLGKSGYSSNPQSFVAFEGEVVFTASVNGWVKGTDTINTGQELVFTNGTLAGTHVLDVYPGSNSSNPEIVGQVNGLLYFTATTSAGKGIYSTNGTTFNFLASISDGASRLAWDSNKAFFSVTDTARGGELWVADFAANTFGLVKDILPGSGSGLSGDVGAFMVNGKLVFKAYTSATEQNLFVSNGSKAGTVQIGASLGAYVALGSTLVFADGNSISAANLSGSTPVKTELVNVGSVVAKMESDTDQAFFKLANGDLYATKGTLSTTFKLASSVYSFKLVAEDAIYFTVSNSQSANGYDLWYSDGTVSGTRFVEAVQNEIARVLDTAIAIRTPGTAAPNDISAPVVTAAVVSGTSLLITMKDDNQLDAAHPPAASAFTLSGTDATVSAVSVDAASKTVTLTLSKSVLSSDTVKVSYADPTTANDTAALQDAAGNDTVSFTNRFVTNQTSDNVGPVFSSAVVNGATLTMTYTDASSLDAVNIPLASRFTLGGTTSTVSSVVVNATNKTVSLTLSASVRSTDAVTLSYADPSNSNDTAAIQDANGYDAASITNVAVTNETADNMPPLFSSAVVNGNTLTMTYTDASSLDASNIPVANKFTLGGTTATVSSVAVNASAKTVTLTLSAAVTSSNVVTVSYADPTSGNDTAAIQDINGYDAASLTNATVVNQTPVPEVKAPWTLLVPQNYRYYSSDGTKQGSDFVTLQPNTYMYTGTKLNVTGDGNYAVYKVECYDNTTSTYFQKAFSIGSSVVAPTPLAADIDVYGATLKVGNKIVFTDSNDPSKKGLITDGTVSGTKLVSDLPNGAIDTVSQTIWANYYSPPYGNELFKISLNDTTPNINLVKDINPGAMSGLNYFTSLGAILPSGKLVFSGYNPTYGYEAWISDGTDSGTFALDLFSGSISGAGTSPNFVSFEGEVVFSANVNGWVKGSDTLTLGQELVFTNGTVPGTHVLDVYSGSNSSSPQIVGKANTLLFFTANTAAGLGFYSTNGTTFTRLGDVGSSVIQLAADANKAFFSVADTANGSELWVADLSNNSFALVKDILQGSGSSLTGNVDAFMVSGKLVFKAYTSATQQNLFISNGTSAGTVQIGSTVGVYKAIGNTLLYVDGNSIAAANLSGATPVNSELVNVGSALKKMESDTDQAFFSLLNGDFYATNGTLNTTVKLASAVKNFKVVADNAIYLVTADTQSTTGYDLWYSDGTLAGTRFIEEVSADVYTNLDNAVAIHTVGVNV
ncbi:SwmB domain-containing protein [Limnohabitans sp. Hippo4]|uniref:SwmB domain-containing protein n=1 Tax=Limnohabitans sp. Hippo4 TaxID=1826167 RepID=UPI000D39213C|nr:SwmB domain-containing protein [Limnohabitans sp. Hippo4]PUE31666.1 hypothetical protein B9Z46_14755 [Limnohabitans sp. Hippo4]